MASKSPTALPRAIDINILDEDVEEEGEEEQQRNRSEDDDEPTEDGAPTKAHVGKEHWKCTF